MVCIRQRSNINFGSGWVVVINTSTSSFFLWVLSSLSIDDPKFQTSYFILQVISESTSLNFITAINLFGANSVDFL